MNSIANVTLPILFVQLVLGTDVQSAIIHSVPRNGVVATLVWVILAVSSSFFLVRVERYFCSIH
jgi:hypothetical protein